MKKVFTGLTILLFTITACAPQMSPETTSIVTEVPTRTSLELTSAQTAAVAALSETLGLPADQIKVVSTETVTWRDGCLGIVRMGIMCTQAEVPGFKIILEADGEDYEFHTNKDGSVALFAEDAQLSDKVEDVLIRQLAQNLGLSEDDISVVSDTVIEFDDACMGVVMAEMMCAQGVAPGHIIFLEADGIQYEYHTNDDGSRIQPATFALTWKREGGIAGFCDSLTVFLSGEIYGNQCKSEDGRMATFSSLFSSNDQKQFDTWIEKYGQVTLDVSDPEGVADGMTLVVELYGTGNGKPGKPVQQEIFTWVQGLFQKLYE